MTPGCHEGIARERRVDRYYDPLTDQFLSVDPDLVETEQPYAFTGDDPLNSTNPLGLKGGPGPGLANWWQKNCGNRSAAHCRAGREKIHQIRNPGSFTSFLMRGTTIWWTLAEMR